MRADFVLCDHQVAYTLQSHARHQHAASVHFGDDLGDGLLEGCSPVLHGNGDGSACCVGNRLGEHGTDLAVGSVILRAA